MLTRLDYDKPEERARLRLYTIKERTGTVDRVVDDTNLIGKNLFGKGTDMTRFTGLYVTLNSGERGVIEGAFGKTGKFKVYFAQGFAKQMQQQQQENKSTQATSSSVSAATAAAAGGKKKKKKNSKPKMRGTLTLRLQKFAFALNKKQLKQP
jgi:selenocysteine-specific elongation factor